MTASELKRFCRWLDSPTGRSARQRITTVYGNEMYHGRHTLDLFGSSLAACYRVANPDVIGMFYLTPTEAYQVGELYAQIHGIRERFREP